MAITGRSHIPSSKTLELIVYIASQLKDNEYYGSIILNKALYHIDGMSYLLRGKSITDFEYIRQGNGPTPKPAQFLAAREFLEENERLKMISVPYYQFIQKKYISDETPNVDLFEKDELKIINDVLLLVSRKNAKTTSDITHDGIPWKLAKPMESLPAYTYLLGSSDPNLKDYEWAESVVNRYETTVA